MRHDKDADIAHRAEIDKIPYTVRHEPFVHETKHNPLGDSNHNVEQTHDGDT